MIQLAVLTIKWCVSWIRNKYLELLVDRLHLQLDADWTWKHLSRPFYAVVSGPDGPYVLTNRSDLHELKSACPVLYYPPEELERQVNFLIRDLDIDWRPPRW